MKWSGDQECSENFVSIELSSFCIVWTNFICQLFSRSNLVRCWKLHTFLVQSGRPLFPSGRFLFFFRESSTQKVGFLQYQRQIFSHSFSLLTALVDFSPSFGHTGRLNFAFLIFKFLIASPLCSQINCCLKSRKTLWNERWSQPYDSSHMLWSG